MSRLQSQLQPPRQRKKVKGMPTLGADVMQTSTRSMYPPQNPAGLAAYNTNPMTYYQNRMQQKGTPYVGDPGQPIQYRPGLPTAMSENLQGNYEVTPQGMIPAGTSPQYGNPDDMLRARTSDADLAGGYMPSPFRQQMSQSAQVQGMIPQYQGAMDVDRGLQYGLPGGLGNAIAPENQQAMLGLIQNQAGRQASVEGLRSQIGQPPSGIPWSPRDAAANANMAQGTPWQPVPGAIGLRTLGTPEEQIAMLRQTQDAAKAAERQKYEQFMAGRDMNKGYAQDYQPETGSIVGTDRYSASQLRDHETAKKAAYERGAARRQGKLQAQRAANYGRSRGLPPGLATAGIQGLDLLAEGSPESVLSESQRAGAGLSALPAMVDNPALAAWTQIAANAPDPAAFVAANPMPPTYVRPGMSAMPSGVPQPPIITEGEDRATYIDRSRQAGVPEPEILRSANESFGDPNDFGFLGNIYNEPEDPSLLSDMTSPLRSLGRMASAIVGGTVLGMPEAPTIPPQLVSQMELLAASGDRRAIEWLKKYKATQEKAKRALPDAMNEYVSEGA